MMFELEVQSIPFFHLLFFFLFSVEPRMNDSHFVEAKGALNKER